MPLAARAVAAVTAIAARLPFLWKMLPENI
jgi:hypothetical protein